MRAEKGSEQAQKEKFTHFVDRGVIVFSQTL